MFFYPHDNTVLAYISKIVQDRGLVTIIDADRVYVSLGTAGTYPGYGPAVPMPDRPTPNRTQKHAFPIIALLRDSVYRLKFLLGFTVSYSNPTL